MSRHFIIITGIALFIFVAVVTTFFSLRHLVRKSFPQTEGSIVIPTLDHPVEVVRDTYGVPHIRASNEHDLMLATGYVHAQDRLWQMDLMRRAGEGRLAEILGPSAVSYDKLFRTIGLSLVADTIAGHLHPESRRILEDYAEGVNIFIASHKGCFPVEFDMLDYEPEPWTPSNSILISRLMAWELNLAWWTDLTYGEIAAQVSPEKFSAIVPGYPDSITVTVPSTRLKKSLSGLHDILELGRSYRSAFGLGSLEAGSNGWVVDSSRSLSGKPLLANDPHLAMPAPSRWYELHLTAPGWEVSGVSVPGVPVVVIGHTLHHAWGLTNAMIDDADFFIEKRDSLNEGRYIVGKSSLPFKEREEKILIRGADSILFIARATTHGPVITDVHPSSSHRHDDSSFTHPMMAMKWTGLEFSDEIYGFYLMNKATSPAEFESGVKEIEVPGQSIVYGDVDNNIAYWTSGKIPLRGKEPAFMPVEGWTGENEWHGYIPFEQMPKLLNPPEGFIACANQKIADKTFPHYISTLWEPPSRIERIRQLLKSSEKFAPSDFMQFQQDVYSPYAREITEHLIAAFKDSAADSHETSEALNYLRNWDFRFTQSDIATSIFNAFFVRLIRNIYEDEMGEEVFRDFVFFGAIPYRVTSQLLAADSSGWFDNIKTDQRETTTDILRLSLEEGLGQLRDTLGTEMKHWRWGALHTVTFTHPFSARKPLDRVFNIGPYPMSGGGTTVNKTEYKFTLPFSVSVGPSMRQIVDLAAPEESYMVITSGESGQPMNSHYDDQTPLWLNGGYHEVTMDWKIIVSQPWPRLELRPE